MELSTTQRHAVTNPGRAGDLPALGCLDPATGPQAFHDHGPVQLGEDASHLAHRCSHRVVLVVRGDLAALGAEGPATALPEVAEDDFLDGELASKPAEAREHQGVGPVALACLDATA